MKVRAKKHLGQHFLHDQIIARRIAECVLKSTHQILEIGPGTGALTKPLLENFPDLKVIEIDEESIQYLIENKILFRDKILSGDFLKTTANFFFENDDFIIVGNFPYNISSQILFWVIENRVRVHQVVGMFQREVAQRIACGPGTKEYGILSVLMQAYYDVEYLFTVNEGSFTPPPKVKSGVIRCIRKSEFNELNCSHHHFFKVVKTAFNQRRKTLRNSLQSLTEKRIEVPYAELRPEKLSVQQFVEITNTIFS